MNGFGKILDGWHCCWMSFCLPAGGYASAQSLKNLRLVLVEPPGIPVNGVRHARIMIPIMADTLRLPVLTNAVSRDQQDQRSLQISLDLCIPKKELAQTRSQILFINFQSHS